MNVSKTHEKKGTGFYFKPVPFFVIFALIFVALVSSHRAQSGSSDFDVYYYAGRAVLSGEPIYTISRQATNLSKSPFVYPPFFAYFISSLAIFPIQVSAVIWNWLNLFCFVVSLLLIHKLLEASGKTVIASTESAKQSRILDYFVDFRSPRNDQHVWYRSPFLFWKGLFWILIGAILIDNLAMAQANLPVLMLILFGMERDQKKKELTSGFWIGVASAIKLIPLIFFVYFLLQRKWKALMGGLLAFIFCFWLFPILVVGPTKNLNYHKAWFEETLHDQLQPKTLGFYSTQLNPSHQNLQAVLFRWLIDWEFRERTGAWHGREFYFHPPWRFTEQEAANIARGTVLILFLVLGVALVRLRRTELDYSQFLSVMSVLLSAMILLSPKARSHFFIFLLFPWAVLLNQIISCEQVKRLTFKKGVFLISILFYFLQGVKYFKFLGAGAFSVLVLFIYFVSQIILRKDFGKAIAFDKVI